jgi:hypothetical protein
MQSVRAHDHWFPRKADTRSRLVGAWIRQVVPSTVVYCAVDSFRHPDGALSNRGLSRLAGAQVTTGLLLSAL